MTARETIRKGTREEWLALRRTGLGGSDAGAIIGVNPWRTAVDVWLDKTGMAQPFEGNDATYWGNQLEDLVAREYAKRTGMPVGNYGYTVRDGCLLANIDRLVQTGDKAPAHHDEVRTNLLLECKTASDVWPDGLPASYEAQVQHYMGLIPQFERADVAVLFLKSRKFEVFAVARDAEVIAELQRVERDFWERYVVGGEMPPPVCEEDCRKLWARSRGVQIAATPEAENALRELRELAARKAELEAAEGELRKTVFMAFGDADTLVGADGKVLATWRQSKARVKTDWKAVAEEAGATEENIGKHTVQSAGARVFLNKYGTGKTDRR